MIVRWVYFLSLIFCISANSASAAPVRTVSGSVEGSEKRGVTAFKGIPFAAPPVGRLRWREPEAPAEWQGVRRADKYGNACIQAPYAPSDVSLGDPGPLSEDCLYLNVWTPKPQPGTKLPVMVWIYGGAFVIGTSGLDITDGGPLASKGAVVVSFNYRLGQLGFFAHPALEKERPGGPANFGLLDQISALKWVKENIAQFGGDPDNVTIFGESAGGKSVLTLFASPLARGLFHKGIVQSSYLIPEMARPKAVQMGMRISDALGLTGKRATMEALRAVPAQKFGALKGKGLSTSPVPISGDIALPRPIEAVFADGEEAPLPLILGNTSDDSSVALAFGVKPAELLKKIGGANLLVKSLYRNVRDEDERARQVTRDLVFTMPVRWIADRHSKLAPTWRYYFDYTAVKLRPKFPSGVSHGGEILCVMNTGDVYQAQVRFLPTQTADFRKPSATIGLISPAPARLLRMVAWHGLTIAGVLTRR
ncbi:MAG: carboxylesterase family protein [Hyphomicrobiales bacterium]|nr:carboxylesterase family protein [Hyphomicrobiales bacterium]